MKNIFLCVWLFLYFLTASVSKTVYIFETVSKPTACGVPSNAQLFSLLISYQCPILLEDPKSSYQLGWPFDYWRPVRYPCGPGPTSAKLEGLWPKQVNMMNASTLIDILSGRNYGKKENGTEKEESKKNETIIYNWCMLVDFYAPNCPFSAKMAPLVNSLPRIFPRLFVAGIDATELSRLNSRYGIAGTPTLLLWHNGKAVARYEESSDRGLEKLLHFLMEWTDLDPVSEEEVLDQDILGPLATTPTIGTDWHFIASWLFIIACSLFYGSKTSPAQRMIETLRHYWAESAENAVVNEDESMEELEEQVIEEEQIEMQRRNSDSDSSNSPSIRRNAPNESEDEGDDSPE